MSGPQFYQTAMGHRFFEGQLPRLIHSLDRIAGALEKPANDHSDKALALIQGIDWEALKQQKQTLLQIQHSMLLEDDVKDIDGLLGLLDAIQDLAVDVLGVPAATVFHFTEE